jgi:hypothetical protein
VSGIARLLQLAKGTVRPAALLELLLISHLSISYKILYTYQGFPDIA